ncbi:MAG: UDP-N-acetylmuramoyl-L-alanine--D-glutamate ligase [bacterium]
MKILLLGLGRANLPVARYLVKQGEEVSVYDENMQNLGEDAQHMIRNGRLRQYTEGLYDLVITSPGFPPNRPICKDLEAKGIPIIDEIDFVYRNLEHPKIIAVTGTNGKSTTAALISNILNEAGIANFLGGNIAPGKPFSQALFEGTCAYYVLEVSSFQLLRIEQFHPYISVLTNLSIDHLNWHKDIDEYKSAKLRVFSNQGSNDFAVLNYDDDWVRGVAGSIRPRVLFFGYHTERGVSINGKFHYDKVDLFSNDALPLAGNHNLMNIAAAIAVSKIINISDSDIEKGVRAFKSLPHRLEELRTIKGIRYINNSMCTNATAAIASFKAIEGSKVVILGGKHKGDEGMVYFDVLIGEAKACVILGENVRFITDYFQNHGFSKFAVAQDMGDAVKKARGFSEPGDVIMLNPGFASFDYFGNFEERGESFKDAVQQD